jgi:hypothetical protein
MTAVGPGLLHGHHVVTASNDAEDPAPRRIVKEERVNEVDPHALCHNGCYPKLLLFLMW